MAAKKLQRTDLMCRIIRMAGMPPGKLSDGYFTKEQLQSLYLFMVEKNQEIENLSKQVQAMAERVLTDGNSLPAPESESL